MSFLYFQLDKNNNHEGRNNRIFSAGDGRRRQSTHSLHQTCSAGRHGVGWYVDDAQTCTGLAKNIVPTKARTNGWKTFGTMEEVH